MFREIPHLQFGMTGGRISMELSAAVVPGFTALII
jgi:hypothetical protein